MQCVASCILHRVIIVFATAGYAVQAMQCRLCSTNTWQDFQSCAAHSKPNASSACQRHAGMYSPAARREVGDANDASWLVNMHVWIRLSTLICLMPASVSRQLCSLARFGIALCLLCGLCIQKSTSAAAIVGSIDCEAACGLSFTCSKHCVRCLGKIWLLHIMLSTQAQKGNAPNSNCCGSRQACNSAAV